MEFSLWLASLANHQNESASSNKCYYSTDKLLGNIINMGLEKNHCVIFYTQQIVSLKKHTLSNFQWVLVLFCHVLIYFKCICTELIHICVIYYLFIKYPIMRLFSDCTCILSVELNALQKWKEANICKDNHVCMCVPWLDNALTRKKLAY